MPTSVGVIAKVFFLHFRLRIIVSLLVIVALLLYCNQWISIVSIIHLWCSVSFVSSLNQWIALLYCFTF